MRAEGWIEAGQAGDELVLHAGGDWLVSGAAALDRKLGGLTLSGASRIRLDLGQVAALDTAGAWLLYRLKRTGEQRGVAVAVDNLPATFLPLWEQVERHPPAERKLPKRYQPGIVDAIVYVGEKTVDWLLVVRDLLGFFGLVVITALRALRHPGRVRMVSVVAQMDRTGVSAMPIVGLLSFLIGVVFAYQGADQLRRFGAEIFTVNLMGIAFLREMGGMLTAIIIAGRSGSAFTAEIGAMQVNQEVDALRTLGLDPVEVLVLPRLLALFVTMPLLTFFANIMGILGGALLCWMVLDITLPVFLTQLRGAIFGWTFWLGLLKAPFFAASIAMIGCREGLNVSGSAESVGRNTTRAVVQSIFLVIVIDAVFSIVFSYLRI